MIEAEQYWPGRNTAGVKFHSVYEKEDADGVLIIREGPYVTTIQGVDIPIRPGEWVVTEADSPDRHYPIAPSVFAAKYEPLPE